MTLEELLKRSDDLEIAINSTTQSVYMLQGHKLEVQYQIGLLTEAHGKAVKPDPEKSKTKKSLLNAKV